MKIRGWRRNVGVAGMAFGVLFMAPFNAWKVHGQHVVNAALPVLERDLVRLGGDKLQDRVQCLDLVGGCYSALYRLGLVQSTGFDGDLQFFGPDDGKVVPYYRKIFWDDNHQNPPIVILLSNEWYQESGYSFNKLYLAGVLRLSQLRIPPAGDEGPFILYWAPMEYRVYVLRGSFADKPGL